MATIMENAAKGQRKALEYLYTQNKRKVFFTAKSLLLDERQASEAAVWVFQNIWSGGSLSGIADEEQFTNEALKMTIVYCRKRAAKQNSKAFRTPPTKNFLITDTGAYDGSGTYTDFVLGRLPELQRFLFITHTFCRFDARQTGKLLKQPEPLVQYAVEAEAANIGRLLAAAGKSDVSCENFIEEMKKEETGLTVPAKAEEQVLAVIDGIAKPEEQKMRKRVTIAGTAIAVCLVLAAGLVYFLRPKQETTNQVSEESEAVLPETGTETAASSLDASLSYYADIEIQDQGTITVALDQKSAPLTTENFVNLAESGFYDGLTFHRIMEGFMMQGGDPEGNGTGGSEHTITGEFSDNGYDNTLSHTRGAVAMARSSDYNSASSQFYIVHQDSEFLDGQYAVFGYVTEGMDIVDAVCESAEPTDDNGTIPAEAQPVISSITIRTE